MDQDRLDSIIARHANTRPSPRHYPAQPDHVRQIADYMALVSGKRCPDPEPQARAWYQDRLDLPTVRSASGMTSSDFAAVMTSALSMPLVESFGDASADIAAIARLVELQDFRKTALDQLAIGLPAEAVEEAPTPKLPFELEVSSTGALRQFGGRVGFSKSVWSSMGAELSAAIQNYGAVFALLEMQQIATTLQAASPATGTGTCDAAGIAVAAAALRNQTNKAGLKTNLPLSAVLCPPALEAVAHKAKRDTGMEFTIAVNAFLSSATTWFAFAPAAASPLLRLILRGNPAPRVFTKMREEPFAEFSFSHDFNYVLLAQPGLVKMSP